MRRERKKEEEKNVGKVELALVQSVVPQGKSSILAVAELIVEAQHRTGAIKTKQFTETVLKKCVLADPRGIFSTIS